MISQKIVQQELKRKGGVIFAKESQIFAAIGKWREELIKMVNNPPMAKELESFQKARYEKLKKHILQITRELWKIDDIAKF